MNTTKKRIDMILAFLIITISNLSAQLELDGYENKYIEDFRYGLFVPPEYNPDTTYHLMVWLHGSGWLNDDYHYWYTEEWQNKYPTIVLTPKCNTTGMGWGNNYDMEETPCIAKAFQALDSIRKYYNIDTTRMHIAGSSMGGIGTFYVLSSRPGMFASAYIGSGGGDTVNVENLLETPLWIFHGAKDPTVPIEYSWNLYKNILKAGGTKVRYTKYRNVGHNTWDYIWKESTLQEWAFSQQLGAEHEEPEASVDDFRVTIDENNKPELSWSISVKSNDIDNFIWAYQVYRNSKLYVTVDRDSLHFTDLDAKAEASYTYSIAPMNYFFLEAEATAEIQVTTAPVTDVQLISGQNSTTIFPNPVRDVLYIKYTGNPDNVSYQLYAVGGELVLKGYLLSGEIDVSALREGVYLIHFISEKGNMYKKVIKL